MATTKSEYITQQLTKIANPFLETHWNDLMHDHQFLIDGYEQSALRGYKEAHFVWWVRPTGTHICHVTDETYIEELVMAPNESWYIMPHQGDMFNEAIVIAYIIVTGIQQGGKPYAKGSVAVWDRYKTQKYINLMQERHRRGL